MRCSRDLARARRLGLLALSTLVLTATLGISPAGADGLLGIYFDRSGVECSGSVPLAGRTLYVVLMTDGATSGGVTGAEFRIDTGGANSYVFTSEEAAPAATIKLGQALGSGTNIAFADCQSGGSVLVASFLALGSGPDAVVRIVARQTQTTFTCPAGVLCDSPTYTEVCVEGGKALLNPSHPGPCGSSRTDSEWSRVKEFYR
jgi:hypothetical protein